MTNILINYQKLHETTRDLFVAIGCSRTDAILIADVLIAAELRGIPSHGIARIIDYMAMYEARRINIQPKPKVVHETPSTATIDGDNAFGMIPGYMAMNLAIEKAKTCGSGWVSVNNSNHYGIAGFYAMMALKNNMIGISSTNANPLVAPTFSVSRFLGTNPLAVAIPAGKYPPFVADFATTPIARGKLAMMEKKGLKAPAGFVQDKKGYSSDDPAILKDGGAILPLGGDYEHGSHKGYCMGALVDIFSSVIGGANFGPFVPPQIPYLPIPENQPGKGLGHFFGAFRIDAFRPASDFTRDMEKWIETFKQAKPAEGHSEVFIPGEPELRNENKYSVEGIPVLDKTWSSIQEIAVKLKLEI
ncbi:MAG: malate dehydrogenase [Bacteroidetes bacterium HGW-Bacteroidetes-21]|jgi:LDH2 family malate/lactate/ureidoglycolate dehydrogenase|nr:MAG: malate dehydrogenase [Bacteroidetes bacterium HGW-Bacteroidetes-21]